MNTAFRCYGKKKREAGNRETAKEGNSSIVAYPNFMDHNASKGIISSKLTSSETSALRWWKGDRSKEEEFPP